MIILKKFVILVLRELAKIQLKKYQAQIIGVTGSLGKTTCVKALHQILKTRFKVKSSSKSYNSEIGVPLSILNQESGFSEVKLWVRVFLGAIFNLLFNWQKYDYLILEMGVDKPNDLKYILSFIHPEIGVFLGVTPVHTEQFAQSPNPLEAIFQEKLQLIKALPVSGIGIVPKEAEISQMDSCIINYGFEENADLKILQASSSLLGLKFTLEYKNKKETFELPLVLGRDYTKSIVPAVAVSLACGISLKEAASALKDFHLPPGRLNLITGIKNTILVDSSYNASRFSMLMALKVLNSFKRRRKIAALGDMRELGEFAQKEHAMVAEKAVNVADEILLVGSLMQKYFLPKALGLGFPKDKIYHFDSALKAAEFLRDLRIKGGEVILFKGSQNTIYLEEGVKLLMKNPKEATSLLCRQEPEWLKIKEKFFKGIK